MAHALGASLAAGLSTAAASLSQVAAASPASGARRLSVCTAPTSWSTAYWF
jgi:hypothetical protein